MGLTAVLGAATSCDKYDIYPEQYGKVMMIKDAGDRAVTIYATEKKQPCYISVMKSGHSPENPSQATIKVLNDEEFAVYKEKYYGSRDFKGLVAVNPDFYYLGDNTDKVYNAFPGNVATHDFVNADDRYYGVNVVFDAQKYSDWWDDLTARANLSDLKIKQDPSLEAVRDAAKDSINSYTYVVPVGLFSATGDTINADNQYVMVTPTVEYPTLSVSVDAGSYLIEDVSRSKLVEDAKFRDGVLEPEVTFSIPCSNEYGFSVKLSNLNAYLETFNSFHTDIVLHLLENKKNEPVRYESCNGEKKVHFPKGITTVKMPLKIYRQYMEPDSLDINYVIPYQLSSTGKVWNAEGTDMIDNDMDWDNPAEVPDKVKKALKLPQSNVTWEEKKDGQTVTQSFGAYCFFVGYRVLETPLEITADEILYCNDAEPSEGSFEGLFDDDLATFFHSTWSQSVPRSTPYGSYFDVRIPTTSPINAVAFQVFARVHSNPKSPKEIALYYTNVYNEHDPDASYWTPFDKVGDDAKTYKVSGTMGSGQLGWFGGIKKDSEWLRAYKYDEAGVKTPASFNVLRFCVLKNTKDEDCCVASNKDTGYWNLAGMKIYGTTLKDNK